MSARDVLWRLVLVSGLALLLGSAQGAKAGPDYDGALLAFPSDCTGRLVQENGDLRCTLRFADGSSITIDLVLEKFSLGSFARYIGVDRARFLANPDGYMRGALRRFEEMAVRERDTGSGDVEIIAQSTRPASATPAQTGLDQCLYFVEDAHVSERAGAYLGRVDISGIRCLGHDPGIDRVWYAYVEVAAVHATDVSRRLPGFDDYSARIVRSLKLN